MKKRTLKLMAVAMVFALIFAFAALPASAADPYTPVAGTSTKFNKFLVVDNDAVIPNITFQYEVRPGTPIPADTTAGTPEILAGVGTPTIADVSFNGDATSTTQPTSGLTLASGKKFAQKEATVSFAGITFNEPGIYRYVITEKQTAGAVGVSYDTQAATPGSRTRYLDVYVVDNSGSLAVSSYVMHETTDIPDVAQDGDPADDKSNSFVNEIATKDLKFGKEVIGNQGSKDKYFLFTLVITNAQANTAYQVDITEAEASPVATAATKSTYTSMSNPTSFTTDGNGESEIHFYLKDGQYISITGLPEGYGYSLTEEAEDYASTGTITAANSTDGTAYTSSTSGSNVTADVKTGYTNERTGVIPTGVLLTIAPFAIGLLLFGALAVFFIARKKKREEED